MGHLGEWGLASSTIDPFLTLACAADALLPERKQPSGTYMLRAPFSCPEPRVTERENK